jgi:hypothetical protein
LGGLLADPVALYPSVFTPNSAWQNHRYLLPNLVVASLQILTLLLTVFFLRETRSPATKTHELGRSTLRLVRNFFRRQHAQRGTYASLPANPEGTLAQATHSPAEQHQLANLNTEEPLPQDLPSTPSRAFTPQVTLQILAVALLAFHKVSSDALTGTFLALEPSTDRSSETTGRSLSFPHAASGFGLSARAIGLVFLAEAAFRAAIQPRLVPRSIARLGGALRAFRCVLAAYPATYLATPFLPGLSLPRPVGLGVMVLDLWAKVALAGVGYVCSAVL